jgi:3-deoxy-D-manno-octulosonate 8-phosphate phosphatase (KDO 8-P phosphatase)
LTFFARNLNYIRLQRALKPDAMARELGIWEDSLRRFERGMEEPDLNGLVQLAEKLNLSLEQLVRTDLEGQQQRLRRQKLRMIIMDVDGTLTDGSLYYGPSGETFKRFNVKDGMAIHRVLKQHPVKMGFLSASTAEAIIRQRAEALGVSHVYAGKRPKTKVVESWLGELAISWKQIAYVGDDLSDLEVMKKAGFAACPADAARDVKNAADYILKKPGGEGCIRELLEEVLAFSLLA